MMDKQPTFEADMRALQTLVEKLEQGETTLEESLAAFEKGTALLKRCRAQLAETETKVEQIMATAQAEAEV